MTRAEKIDMVMLMWKASLKAFDQTTKKRISIPKNYRIAYDENVRDDIDEHKRRLDVYNTVDDTNTFNLPMCLENYESLLQLLKLNFPDDDYEVYFQDINGII